MGGAALRRLESTGWATTNNTVVNRSKRVTERDQTHRPLTLPEPHSGHTYNNGDSTCGMGRSQLRATKSCVGILLKFCCNSMGELLVSTPTLTHNNNFNGALGRKRDFTLCIVLGESPGCLQELQPITRSQSAHCSVNFGKYTSAAGNLSSEFCETRPSRLLLCW